MRAAQLAPATTRSLSIHSRTNRAAKYVHVFRKETGDPVWRLIDAAQSQYHRLGLLSEALHSHDLSVDEYRRWKPVLREPDIGSAISTFHNLDGLNNHGMPPWVLLYLASYKVHTSQHATGPLMDLVSNHLPTMDDHGPLIILTTLHLARFSLLIPIRRMTDCFLTTPTLRAPDLYFNMFLQALSANPIRSVESANTTVNVLKAMDARQLKLRSETYSALLNDRFVTLQLTKYLRERMVQEGFVPRSEHLEAYLRIFAKNGAIHDAQTYFDAIHAHAPTPGSTAKDDQAQRDRANTLFLSAQEDRGSALNFLARLMAPVSQPSTPPDSNLPVANPQIRAHKPKLDIYDYSAALSVAARDLSTPSSRLIQLFKHTLPSPQRIHSHPGHVLRPTVVTHTILIRGLLQRKAFKAAVKCFQTLLASGLTLDKQAIAVGVQALVRDGKIANAIELLEQFCAPVRKDGPRPGGSHPFSRRRSHIQLSTISINDCLVSLNRISRPDVVFLLFTHMGTLYNVYPDARTLSIILQSARLATKMNQNTVSGAVTELLLHNPFRRRKGNTIRDSASHREYSPGLWGDELPADAARAIFLRALFGSAPNAQKLLDIIPPAQALRTVCPPAQFVHIAGASLYPGIVVTNANCMQYLLLLSLTERAPEIPLVLAWMRALGIQPSSSTLAVSMALWAEVSVQAPFVEWWMSGSGPGSRRDGEYGKLISWLREWVGEGRIPRERELGKWETVVERIRGRDS
ncbi:hypothetical protein BD779DRAFT_1521882 [Infundibulicybe gibba]|nr:hypothetical protein BD779DRAFT_1521882 [Infundibulicybe gibba]